MEGKRQDWEAVVVLEFIAVQRLLDAERCLQPSSLTSEEVQRNGRGFILEFSHHPGHPGTKIVGPAPYAAELLNSNMPCRERRNTLLHFNTAVAVGGRQGL